MIINTDTNKRMDKKMKKLFGLVFIILNLMQTEHAFSQLLTALDSVIRIRPEHTFIIGETHPCQVESRGIEESISQNLISNYFDYKLIVTESIIRNRATRYARERGVQLNVRVVR